MTPTAFPSGVHHHIDYYVYRLIDPRDGVTFYVGKGKGDRVFDHARGIVVPDIKDGEDTSSLKIARIQEVLAGGQDIAYVVHRHGMEESVALEVEAALIDAYPALSNIQGGQGSRSRGPMSLEDIIFLYALPVFPNAPSEKLILININKVGAKWDKEQLLTQVQFAWRIDTRRAEKADYVLAIYQGIVLGAFCVNAWLPATSENFPEHYARGGIGEGRKGFKGAPAPDDVWDSFVGKLGKRIENDEMKHIQNPIRYWNC